MNPISLRNYRKSFKKKGLGLLFSIFLGASFFLSLPSFAQSDSLTFYFGKAEQSLPASYVLTGKISSLESGEVLAGVGVYVNGTFSGVVTDKFGYYLISLPPGIHRVVFRHISHAPRITEVHLYDNGVINLDMALKNFELDGVVVMSDDPDRNVRNPISGVAKLSTKELKAIPAFMGEADIFKGLQMMPGVSSVGEGTSGINVRGAKTDQNLILMNEAVVLSSNHALGFLSAFNTDVTENFTLYKGNLPANYGGRAGAALDISMRPGSMEAWQGQVGLGTSNGKLLLEGPLVKEKLSVIVGARKSNVNWLLGQARNLDIQASSLNFYDGYLGMQWKIAQGHSLEMSTMLTGDTFQFSDQFGFAWSNALGTLRYKGILGEKIALRALVASGNFGNTFLDPAGVEAAEVSNGMRYQQVKGYVTWADDQRAFSVGVEAIHYQGKPEKRVPNGEFSAIQPEQVGKERGIEGAAFLTMDYELRESTSLIGGLRYSRYSQLGPDTVFQYRPLGPKIVHETQGYRALGSGVIQSYGGWEPRLALRQNLSSRTSLKLSYARLYQYIQSISSTVGPTPIDLWQLSTPYIPPQHAANFSLGLFTNSVGNTWEFTVDGFYRFSKNQVEYRDFANLFLNPQLETALVFGKGKAYGMEFMVKKNLGILTGWIAYTYSRSLFQSTSLFTEEQINGNAWTPANYDKPHEVNLILSRKMYPRGLLNLTMNYSTGRPVSAVTASYYLNGGLVVPDYSLRNAYRIPDYFRVDFSYTVEKVFSKKGDSLNFGVYNLFGRKNAYSVFWKKDGDSQQLRPYRLAILGAIFPSISYSIQFGGTDD
jgi:CarboxypepD_reg-like domain/TonB-dependent Receptor Plug Domain